MSQNKGIIDSPFLLNESLFFFSLQKSIFSNPYYLTYIKKMAKIVKKGVKGAAANFITRQQALNKLQISLADFR